jgi:hypothetical protein
MYKPLNLFVAACCALPSYGQKSDTISLFYKSDQYSISLKEKQKLDSFLLHGWDRLSINGYTDETEGEEYNLELSKKRSGEVYLYCKTKKIPAGSVMAQFYGESMPMADNSSENGRSLNRRTDIIGYRFARIMTRPKEDQMKPVTQTLDNGFIITYRPGSLPEYLEGNFAVGSGMNFQLITNTTQMRQNNLFNNTTNGEILSSVLIVCGGGFNPCKLDTPVLIKVPVPYTIKCPITKVKFFNAVIERGRSIWKEETKFLYPEMINGKQYVGVWMDDFCQCINFDFKIDPECFDTDSTKVQYVNATIKNLSAELKGLNSVYLPRRVADSIHSILYLKNKLDEASISFSLYNEKRRIKTFRDEQLTTFPYNEISNQYLLSTGSLKFYFPKVKVYDVVLRVNKDKYRVYPQKGKCEVVYLNRKVETILVDFSVIESRGRIVQYKDQPISSLPFDESNGYRVINKDFIKLLKQKGTVAEK